MSEDKRRHERYDVQQDVYMVLEESSILCHLQNISCAGAYMKVNEKHNGEIAEAQVGDSVEVIFNEESFRENVKGKILRRDNAGAVVFLAVYFMQQYNFPFLS